MRPNVAITYNEESRYPSDKFAYSPSKRYPEYPFESEISGEDNMVYDMVRNTLYEMGYDKENFGTKSWNPFKGIIKHGNKVLIKPNWVMNFNKAIENQKDLSALVTHPSVIRVIADYVYIALNGSGKIYIADAPMQECCIEEIFENAGYEALFEFWKKNIEEIEIRDLRHYSTIIDNNVIVEKKDNDYNESVTVNLASKSYHNIGAKGNEKYKVSQYLEKETQSYHNANMHKYVVNKLVLDVDVIINVPKPKCHRLAGMTAALKNMVGIIYDKNSLPHRKIGSPKEGGDSYEKSNFFKRCMENADEKKTRNSLGGHYTIAQIYSFFEKVFYVLGSTMSRDKARVGGWYGNDTIWRTILDLNTIINYSDENGVIHNEKQRKMITIGDMIICGQKNGPITPIPKYLGMIMISENSFDFDSVMCKMMGFDYSLIRYITKYAINNENRIDIIINGEIFKLMNFQIKKKWNFVPHEMWKKE